MSRGRYAERRYEGCTIQITRKQREWLEKKRREGGFRSLAEATRDLIKDAMVADEQKDIAKEFCICKDCRLFGVCPYFGYRLNPKEIKKLRREK